MSIKSTVEACLKITTACHQGRRGKHCTNRGDDSLSPDESIVAEDGAMGVFRFFVASKSESRGGNTCDGSPPSISMKKR